MTSPAVNVIRNCDQNVQSWRNGQGVTREIARASATVDRNDFDWRLSRASFSVDSEFSVFRGVDRQVLVLQGEFVLRTPDGVQRRLAPDQPVAEFRGDHGGSAEVMRAPVEDLNLMLRRSSARGSLRRVRGINLLHATVSGQQVFIHALQACTVCVGTKRYALCSGDTAQLYAAHAAESSITLDGTDIDVAVAEITMLADSA